MLDCLETLWLLNTTILWVFFVCLFNPGFTPESLLGMSYLLQVVWALPLSGRDDFPLLVPRALAGRQSSYLWSLVHANFEQRHYLEQALLCWPHFQHWLLLLATIVRERGPANGPCTVAKLPHRLWNFKSNRVFSGSWKNPIWYLQIWLWKIKYYSPHVTQ